MTDAPDSPVPPNRQLWLWVGVLTLIGLGLRLAAAQGALWLDEAWSAVSAVDVGTPMGVFLKINHDNNHHLTSLWLQAVGPDAAPMLQRALSIASGTLAIPLAAAIALRQGTGAAIVAALLFATSPLLVTYGAEARGYAPMVLALLGLVLMVARWLDDPEQRPPWIGIGLAVLVGMLAQLTMAFGLAAVVVWSAFVLWRRGKLRRAAVLVPALLLPAIAVIALVFGAAWQAGTGLQFGNYERFAFGAFAHGWGAMMLGAFGGPVALLGALVLIAPSDNPGDRAGQARDRMFFLLALAIPLGVALLQLANSGAPRYHLLSGVGALMLAAIHSGPRLARSRRLRWVVAAALLLVTIASLITDWRIIQNRRADPGRALDMVIAAGAPDLAVERDRAAAIFRAAAASRRYRLEVIEAHCPATRFLFVDRDGNEPFHEPMMRCGAHYRAVAEGHPTGLSGTHWKLYERVVSGR